MPHGKPHGNKAMTKPMARTMDKPMARPTRRFASSPLSGTKRTMSERLRADREAMRRRRRFTRPMGRM